MLAAIYARYSSDRQRDTSLADQESVCRRRAATEGLTVAHVYADAALSGARVDRPQYRQLLADAATGAWQALLVEDLSRLSRDEVEGVQSVRRLEHRGIRVIGVADGYDSARPGRTAQRGVRALLSALYLEDLAARTHRGLEGQARRGYWTGGRAYGYRVERLASGAGSILRIEPPEADVVRRIFQEYSSGRSPRAIAAGLNQDRIPGPRSATWAFSAIYGHPAKGTGILRNPSYIGRPRWNASKWEKDPDTGARVRRERPAADWISMDVPELRIIDQPLWEAAQQRLAATRQAHRAGPQHRHLLSGLLTCGHCGGAIAVVNRDRYGCTWARYRGPAVCDQRRTFRRDLAEQRLLSGVATDLYSPAAVAAYRAALLEELRQASAAAAPDIGALRRQLADVDSRIANLVAEIAGGTRSQAISAALEQAELDRSRLDAQLRAAAAPPIPLITDIEGTLRRQLESLGETLAEGETAEARAILGELLGPVRVYARDGKVEAELSGIPGQYAIDGSGGRI